VVLSGCDGNAFHSVCGADESSSRSEGGKRLELDTASAFLNVQRQATLTVHGCVVADGAGIGDSRRLDGLSIQRPGKGDGCIRIDGEDFWPIVGQEGLEIGPAPVIQRADVNEVT